MTRRLVWAFDVDGTIIGSIRSDRLRPGTPELLEALRDRDVHPVLWSAGGADYARRMARTHGIETHFVGFYAKQARDGDGRYVVDHLASDHRPTTFVDDVPADMPRWAAVIGVSQFMGGNPADRVLVRLREELDTHLPSGTARPDVSGARTRPAGAVPVERGGRST